MPKKKKNKKDFPGLMILRRFRHIPCDIGKDIAMGFENPKLKLCTNTR